MTQRSNPATRGADPPWTATNTAGHEAPAALAVDAVVLTVRNDELQTLVVYGLDDAFALPGGLVVAGETAEQTAERKLREKTGLPRVYLEQLAAFTDPGRDRRGWIPTIAHLALVPPSTQSDDDKAQWVSARKPPPLAYDHNKIIKLALERLAGKLWWSNIAVGILPEAFTLTEARYVYQAIAGATYDASTFRRDLRATGLIRATGETRPTRRGRPATLYTFVAQNPIWGEGRRKRVAHG